MKISLVALASVTMFSASAYAFVPAVRTAVGRSVSAARSANKMMSSTALNMVATTPADYVKKEIAENNVRASL